MKIQKSLTALGAALMIISISAPASAFECGTDASNPYDKDVIAAGLQALAEELRCVDDSLGDNLGLWSTAPIWQKGREGSCDIHASLARKLLEFRVFSDGNKPPKNKNETNLAAGASWDVKNEKFEGALSKLDSFLDDAKKARLNEANGDAFDQRYVFLHEVNEARTCVYHFTL
jgi:hypothetical protein